MIRKVWFESSNHQTVGDTVNEVHHVLVLSDGVRNNVVIRLFGASNKARSKQDPNCDVFNPVFIVDFAGGIEHQKRRLRPTALLALDVDSRLLPNLKVIDGDVVIIIYTDTTTSTEVPNALLVNKKTTNIKQLIDEVVARCLLCLARIKNYKDLNNLLASGALRPDRGRWLAFSEDKIVCSDTSFEAVAFGSPEEAVIGFCHTDGQIYPRPPITD